MHPHIRKFPSQHFYDDQLTDGPNITLQTYHKPFHTTNVFAPFVFFNVETSQEFRGSRIQAETGNFGNSTSLKNPMEVKFVSQIISKFVKSHPSQVIFAHKFSIFCVKFHLKKWSEIFIKKIGEKFNDWSGYTLPTTMLSFKRRNGKFKTEIPRTFVGHWNKYSRMWNPAEFHKFTIFRTDFKVEKRILSFCVRTFRLIFLLLFKLVSERIRVLTESDFCRIFVEWT